MQHQEMLLFFQYQREIFGICPCCNEFIRLSDCKIYKDERKSSDWLDKLGNEERKLSLQQLTAKKKQKIENTTQSVNMGFILERLAPVLEEFRFNKNDCRSLFDPIDYVIFDGLHKNGKVQKIFFIDIKSGAAKLKKNQKAIKTKIEEKKVEFKLY